MMKEVSVVRYIAFFLVSGIVSSYGATNTRQLDNQEYKFSVRFPDIAVVCTHVSGSHPHGFYILFNENPIDCHDASVDINDISTRGIGVYAYANSTFELSPEQELADLCKPGELKGLAFNGRRSAACEVTSADGVIDIYVVTQAGEWPGPKDSPELKPPFINYTASLRTNAKSRSADVQLFREVLNSVHIYYPK